MSSLIINRKQYIDKRFIYWFNLAQVITVIDWDDYYDNQENYIVEVSKCNKKFYIKLVRRETAHSDSLYFQLPQNFDVIKDDWCLLSAWIADKLVAWERQGHRRAIKVN